MLSLRPGRQELSRFGVVFQKRDVMDLDAGFAPTGEWECMECGYIQEGAKTKRPKVCPDCGAPGQALEFFPFGDYEEEEASDVEESWDDETSDDDVFEDEDLR
jgi:hypothetical protein